MSVLRQENGVKLAPSIAVDTTTTTGNTADTAMSSSAAPSPAGTSPTQYVTVTIVALTTTFTGPASCAEARLTQLSSPVYEIWVNEPQPVPGTRFGDCFPSQFIEGYSSVGNASTSVAPFFSPLVCPSAWHTARIWENGYIACCISYVCCSLSVFFVSLPQEAGVCVWGGGWKLPGGGRKGMLVICCIDRLPERKEAEENLMP